MIAEELAQIELDLKYWKDLEYHLDWRVIGFSGKESATFSTDEHHTIQLTGKQRDDIMRSIGV